MFTAEERRNYIGGSDIAAVMGMSRWKTPLKLWLEKTGEDEPADLSQVEAVQLGTELEEFVAQKFARKEGKQVRKQNKMYIHKDYPFMAAHVDRLITGSDELLECKTCGSHKKDEWQGEDIPQEYVLQVMWYLGITGRKRGYIAVLIGGQSFKSKPIDFDQELFDTMVEMAKNFWECVKTKTPPAIMPQDDEIIARLYPENSSKMIDLDVNDEKIAKLITHHETNIKHLQEIKEQMKHLEDERREIETYLKYLIKGEMGIRTPQYCVTWKSQSATNINTERMKTDDIYEKYADKTTTRVLRVTATKKAA